MAGKFDKPPLLDLVQRDKREMVSIDDFVFVSKDVSNSHLVTTSDGDVLINAGTTDGGRRHRELFTPVRRGPLRYAVITQGHPDHFGGLAELKEPGTQVIMQENNTEVRDYWVKLKSFYADRMTRIWSGGQPRPAQYSEGSWEATPEQPVDILFRDEYSFEVGERRFELFSTPGGETTDSLIVWLPRERIVFTGNLFGPMFMNTPFLNTLRGDKIRDVKEYIANVDRVRSLEPEILVTGHGNPYRDAAIINRQLTQLSHAVQYLHDRTIEGMNAGKDVYTLMREIRLPHELEIGEGHGKIAWAIRSIYVYYNGWFDFESLADMYDIPLKSLTPDLVRLAGGPDVFAEQAAACLHDRAFEKVIHLTDMALTVEPDHPEILEIRIQALVALLKRCGNENLSETLLLGSAIRAAESALKSRAV